MIKCKIVSSCVVEVDGIEENLIDTKSDLSGLEGTEGYFITRQEIGELTSSLFSEFLKDLSGERRNEKDLLDQWLESKEIRNEKAE